MKLKALILFSGGLDSILAAKILMKQGIKITALNFKSYFFGPEEAEKAAKNLGIKLKVVDFSKEHFKMVKSPKYGYGSSMNPCIDCHILMLKKAKEIMKKEKFGFVATGEVLGERPMSQNRKTLELIEKESSLKGYLLRPLSAKKLEETIPEKKKKISRQKLLNISGRFRKRQIELAQKWGIRKYPFPAGGGLLTDLEFGEKLKQLFEKYPKCNENDIELLKLGRHFWCEAGERIKIIVGRNHEENLRIKKLARKTDIVMEMKNYPGPTSLIRNYAKKKKILTKDLERAKFLTKYYSTKARSKADVKFVFLS